jgi:hypothetical protein
MPPTPGRRGEPKHLGQPLAVRGQHPPASPRCRGAQALELLEVTLPLNKRRLHDLHSAILGPLGAGIEASRFYRAWRTRGFADMAPGMCTTSAAQSRGHGGTSSSTAKLLVNRAAPLPRALNRHRTSQQRMCSLDGKCLIERDSDQRFHWSAPVWSPPPESNRRPHPYHGTTRNRCADRRFPRSRPTVGVEVIGSLSARLCALLSVADRAGSSGGDKVPLAFVELDRLGDHGLGLRRLLCP